MPKNTRADNRRTFGSRTVIQTKFGGQLGEIWSQKMQSVTIAFFCFMKLIKLISLDCQLNHCLGCRLKDFVFATV